MGTDLRDDFTLKLLPICVHIKLLLVGLIGPLPEENGRQ